MERLTTNNFVKCLIETKKWCEQKFINLSINNKKSNGLLIPEHPIRDFNLSNMDENKFIRIYQLITKIILKRREKLDSLGYLDFALDAIKQDDLLLSYPQYSLCDGGAMGQTNGYFDDTNLPPFDTWINGFFTENKEILILCYVPKVFKDIVQEGILVEPSVSLANFSDLEDENIKNFIVDSLRLVK